MTSQGSPGHFDSAGRESTSSALRTAYAVVGATAATITLWAAAFVLIRVALTGFTPSALSVARLVIASSALGVVGHFAGVRRPAVRDLPLIVMCGITGMVGYQLLLNAGERTVDAGTASILVNTGPLFAAVIAFALLRERISEVGWLGVVIGCLGGTMVALSLGSGLTPTSDALMVLAAAVSQATFFVLQKPLLGRYTGLEVTAYATWAGTLLSLPLGGSLVAEASSAGFAPWLALVTLGLGPSAAGYALWAYVQARAPVAVATNSLYLVPFVAVTLGWVALGEPVTPLAVAGGVVALLGVLISRQAHRGVAAGIRLRPLWSRSEAVQQTGLGDTDSGRNP